MEADYKTTLGTIVLENIVIRNGITISYNYLGSPTHGDHNSKRQLYSNVSLFFVQLLELWKIRENARYL